MVDFQSRDTSRGLDTDDDEEDEEPDEEKQEADELAAESDADAANGTATTTESESDRHGEEVADAPTGEDDGAAPTDTPDTATDTKASGTGGGEATPAAEETATAYAVVTVTADRSLSDDNQGDTVVDAVEGAGAGVVTRNLVQPDYDGIQSTLTTLAGRGDVDIVVAIGGTGVEPDDVTVDALDPLFEKRLPGFGELFRLLAHETEGTAVVGTRATAGIVEGTPVFAVPGTVEGARHAVEEIVLQEGPHLAADAAGEPR